MLLSEKKEINTYLKIITYKLLPQKRHQQIFKNIYIKIGPSKNDIIAKIIIF